MSNNRRCPHCGKQMSLLNEGRVCWSCDKIDPLEEISKHMKEDIDINAEILKRLDAIEERLRLCESKVQKEDATGREKFPTGSIFQLDVVSNQLIKKYRKELGFETPVNRIDTGDLKCIFLALDDLNFEIVRKEGS